MRQSWTDDRLDDLSHRMDSRFDQVDDRFDRMDDRFNRMDDRFDRFEAEMRANNKSLRDEMNAINAERRSEFDALHRTLIQVGGGFIAALVGVLITQL